MSVRIPDVNSLKTGGSAGYRLTIPSTVAQKAASTSYTTAFWFRTPDVNYPGSAATVVLAREGGASSGRDGYVRIDQAVTQLRVAISNGSGSIYDQTIAVQKGKTYMVMLIANSVNTHLVVCEPDGTLTRVTTASNALHAAAMTTFPMWKSVGGPAAAWYGLVENLCVWTGNFPETTGIPDETLIASIAAGTQSLSGIPALTGQTLKFHYPLAHEADLADAGGGAALTETNKDRPTGFVSYPSGPLRPVALMPAMTMDCISQVTFGTPGDAGTATAQIKVEAGIYSGLPAMAKVQVRLLDESRAQVAGWIDLTTTAPSGGAGTWAASSGFPAVPIQASYLTREFRALDGSGNVIAGPVCGYGLSGAGFHLLGESQSQWAQLFNASPDYAVTAGIRHISTQQFGNEYLPAAPTGEPEEAAGPYFTTHYMISSGASTSHGYGLGNRAMANEINALYPGVPVQLSYLGKSGTSLSFYSDYNGSEGPLTQRWGKLRDALGIVQPYLMLFLGHSQGTDDTAGKLAAAVAWSQANYGTPLQYLHVPVPRYRGLNDTIPAAKNSRNGARDYCIANPGMNRWMGSWSTIFTNLTAGAETGTGSDPHPGTTIHGHGRTGSLIGLAWLMGARAVPDVPIGITAVQAVGSTAVIRFGAVNP